MSSRYYSVPGFGGGGQTWVGRKLESSEKGDVVRNESGTAPWAYLKRWEMSDVPISGRGRRRDQRLFETLPCGNVSPVALKKRALNGAGTGGCRLILTKERIPPGPGGCGCLPQGPEAFCRWRGKEGEAPLPEILRDGSVGPMKKTAPRERVGSFRDMERVGIGLATRSTGTYLYGLMTDAECSVRGRTSGRGGGAARPAQGPSSGVRRREGTGRPLVYELVCQDISRGRGCTSRLWGDPQGDVGRLFVGPQPGVGSS